MRSFLFLIPAALTTTACFRTTADAPPPTPLRSEASQAATTPTVSGVKRDALAEVTISRPFGHYVPNLSFYRLPREEPAFTEDGLCREYVHDYELRGHIGTVRVESARGLVYELPGEGDDATEYQQHRIYGQGYGFDEYLDPVPGERLHVTATGGKGIGAFAIDIVVPPVGVHADASPHSTWHGPIAPVTLSWDPIAASDVALYFERFDPGFHPLRCDVPNVGRYVMGDTLVKRVADHAYVTVFAGVSARVEPETGGVVIVRVGDEQGVDF
jgi:hypothetical protein